MGKNSQKPEQKTKQLQMNKEEFLSIQLIQQKIVNLQMQTESMNRDYNAVIKQFCERVKQKPENIATSNGQVFISRDGKVTFKE